MSLLASWGLGGTWSLSQPVNGKQMFALSAVENETGVSRSSVCSWAEKDG